MTALLLLVEPETGGGVTDVFVGVPFAPAEETVPPVLLFELLPPEEPLEGNVGCCEDGSACGCCVSADCWAP